ncbi:aldehyde dehydrogenase (NADP(+)) [Nesterenkonia ebinurensis]|uniref:aldehyde dehydrogenase (NADP(+)) n=1 Tax=Nesterenkonia ebinurensis TaxID=2608252 RepID=UPI00123CFC4B|nr:aldehyde dehydrogenase (NADP(+)) [Nesterenkonia ebinurensis]
MTTLPDATHHSLIAGEPAKGTDGVVRAIDPARNEETGPEFTTLAESQEQAAAEAAAEAFGIYRKLTDADRAAFLTTVAENINAAGEEIIATAMTETGLPQQRLTGELARTVNQLKMFAKLVANGDHHSVRTEPALPDRTPLPRPDLRQRKLPLGPVVVFGASNFPLAFSTAGGDTASALAAGCPVIFKAHLAHPGTGLLVAQAIAKAVADHNLPAGVFSLVYGRGTTVGQSLVKHPAIKAVGFTGSRFGGTSIMATAAARPEPIPVYAEMSSVNPVMVLDSAIKGDSTALAEGFITSLNGSAGQLCTVPGLIFVPGDETGDTFLANVKNALAETAGVTMLTPGICSSRVQGEKRLTSMPGVTEVGRGTDGQTANALGPAVFSTDVETFLTHKELSEEIFGATCLAVRYASAGELQKVASRIEGQLTATLHLDTEDPGDVALAADLVELLELKAGRVLVNGWPTGVDVGDAIVHGGPFPATSDGRSTSVGTAAIDRFQRLVAYQNLPAALHPAPVHEDNPWDVPQRTDFLSQLR